MNEDGLALDALETENKEGALEGLAKIGKMRINVSETERWVSAGLGAGLLAYGLRKRSRSGWLFALAGSGLLLRGVMGRSIFYRLLGINTATGAGLPGHDAINVIIRVDKSIVIERKAEELFGFLRDLGNLPMVLKHLRDVRSTEGNRSHWSARMPAGADLEWEAEVHEERKPRKIAWRIFGDTGLQGEGAWILDAIGDGSRTQVGLHLEYNLPEGKIGLAFAKLFGKHPDRLIDEELHRFKTYMEGTD